MESEDKQFIIEFVILAIFAGICIIGTFLIMSFIFFYGDPMTIVIACLLVLFRINICDSGTEISLIKILHRYIKISVTIVK